MESPGRLRIIFRFLRQEGIPATVCRLLSAIVGLIYKHERVFVLSRPVAGEAEATLSLPGLVLEELNAAAIVDLEAASYTGHDEILRRFKSGQICIVARLDGQVVHYSWLSFKDEFAGEIEREISVGRNECYLYNCRTLSTARGKGIFPAVIARACGYAATQHRDTVVALVAVNNFPSLRAFEKVGFSARSEISMTRILWIRRYREVDI